MEKKMVKKIIFALALCFLLLFSGCKMMDSIFPSNKIAASWTGTDETSTTMSASLNLSKNGTFKAVFTEGSEEYKLNGSYSHTPQQTWLFTKNEAGAVVFRWDGHVVACEYLVTSSSLMLWGWKDRDGNLRNLSLFR